MGQPPPLPGPARGASRRRGSEYLWMNLSFPGVGSYQAGWRVSGICQAGLAVAGFILTNVFAFWFCRLWYQSGEIPILTLLRVQIPPASWTKPLLFGLGGVMLFLLAAGWALVTSLMILRSKNGDR
jgi:uncharacterized integral membrane protein